MLWLLLSLALAAGHDHRAQGRGAAAVATVAANSWSNATSTLFQGTNDTVDFGNNLGGNLSNTEWTLSMWARPTSLAAQVYLAAKADPFGSGSMNWVVGFTTDGKFYGYWGAVGKTTESSAGAISTNTWYHLASTVRNISGTYTANIWINGTKVGSDVTAPGTDTSSVVARVGSGYVADSPDTLFPLTGYVDEVTFWSVGMTQAQVQALYNSGHPGNPLSHSQAASLTHYYRMGDGDTFPTISDRQGSVNGTCTNMAGAGTNFTSTVP